MPAGGLRRPARPTAHGRDPGQQLLPETLDELFEAGRDDRRLGKVVEIGQGPAAPQGHCLAEGADRTGGISFLDGAPALGSQPLHVLAVRRGLQDVPIVAGRDFQAQPTQPKDVGGDRVAGGHRRVVTPGGRFEVIRRDRPGHHRQSGKDAALEATACRELGRPIAYDQWTQDAHLHAPTVAEHARPASARSRERGGAPDMAPRWGPAIGAGFSPFWQSNNMISIRIEDRSGNSTPAQIQAAEAKGAIPARKWPGPAMIATKLYRAVAPTRRTLPWVRRRSLRVASAVTR